MKVIWRGQSKLVGMVPRVLFGRVGKWLWEAGACYCLRNLLEPQVPLSVSVLPVPNMVAEQRGWREGRVGSSFSTSIITRGVSVALCDLWLRCYKTEKKCTFQTIAKNNRCFNKRRIQLESKGIKSFCHLEKRVKTTGKTTVQFWGHSGFLKPQQKSALHPPGESGTVRGHGASVWETQDAFCLHRQWPSVSNWKKFPFWVFVSVWSSPLSFIAQRRFYKPLEHEKADGCWLRKKNMRLWEVSRS